LWNSRERNEAEKWARLGLLPRILNRSMAWPNCREGAVDVQLWVLGRDTKASSEFDRATNPVPQTLIGTKCEAGGDEG
jgi:hypothetical protein